MLLADLSWAFAMQVLCQEAASSTHLCQKLQDLPTLWLPCVVLIGQHRYLSGKELKGQEE